MRAAAFLALTAVLGLSTAAPAYAQPSSEAPPASSGAPAQQQQCVHLAPNVDPSVPWAQKQLAPERVWPLTNGAGITVGVVDTGVDASVPQLRGQVLAGVDTTASGGTADSDCHGHGTSVAGIIAAIKMDGTGYVGVAPGVRILPVRCATTDDPKDPNALTPEGMARGIRAAVDGGAQVINISASTTEQNPALADAVDYAAQHDVVVVASAANTGNEGNLVTYPAAYPSVIAVGAVDEKGQHADFSQVGPFVSLVAPGVDVLVLGPGGPGQAKVNGTSYSAPFVAGIAALVRAYRPGLSAEQVKHRLLVTANHPPGAVPDPALGWGMVNPLGAVTTVLPEEGDVRPVPLMPPDALPAPAVARDEAGPVLAVAGEIGAVALALALILLTRLLGAGRRRGFRPARVVEVATPAELTTVRRDNPDVQARSTSDV